MTAAPTVSLVIPGRNCAATIGPCLDAVTPMLNRPETHLTEILYVDDGSTDNSVELAQQRSGVTIIKGDQRGPGSARNIGWRSAKGEFIWFVDSDCVAEPDALVRLLPHMMEDQNVCCGLSETKATQCATPSNDTSRAGRDSNVAFEDSDHDTRDARTKAVVGGVSGSYGNMRPESLLSCLIHEEIVARHQRMADAGPEVNFLATFNVLYRRSVLEEVGGLDERYLKGQDAELSFRVMEAGCRLRFEIESRVRHFHEHRWLKYLRTQRQQGYWRVFLHLQHRGHAAGDSYSNFVDHLQPVLAMMSIVTLPLILFAWTWWIPLVLIALLALSTLPMTMRLVRATGRADYLAFAGLSFLRAYWRGVGMTLGALAWIRSPRRATEGHGGGGRDRAKKAGPG